MWWWLEMQGFRQKTAIRKQGQVKRIKDNKHLVSGKQQRRVRTVARWVDHDHVKGADTQLLSIMGWRAKIPDLLILQQSQKHLLAWNILIFKCWYLSFWKVEHCTCWSQTCLANLVYWWLFHYFSFRRALANYSPQAKTSSCPFL